MTFTPSQVKIFANAGPRLENLDNSGGGSITRTFYVEPYSAYPYVETFLKGTVVKTQDGPPAVYGRVKPHADPIKPWFYCSSVFVQPFAAEAITGMAVAQFTPSTDYSVNPTPAGGSQQAAIDGVLDCIDDHSYGNIVDFAKLPPLTPAQIQVGGIQFPTDGTSTGRCGAYITATYTPLIFQDGLQTSGENPQDPFDYVNPTWTPIEVSTQVGRNLFFYTSGGENILLLQGGLLETFNRPEVLYEFSVTRLMVPFFPMLTYGIYNNKINDSQGGLGNTSTPLGTVRFLSPEPPPLLRAPDGATFYNITLKFLFRKLWDSYFDVTTFVASPGKPPKGFIVGWVDWNHQFGIPQSRTWPNSQSNIASYYPVAWNDQIFQGLFGNIGFGGNHPLYLRDQDVQASGNAVVSAITGNILTDPFNVGFQTGQ